MRGREANSPSVLPCLARKLGGDPQLYVVVRPVPITAKWLESRGHKAERMLCTRCWEAVPTGD